MTIKQENLKQHLDTLEQKNSGRDVDGNHYVIVASNDGMIREDKPFDTVIIYVLAVRVGDALDEDNCLPLYQLEWHYGSAEFQQIMEKYDNDWGALDWTKPTRATLAEGRLYDLENDEVV